MKKTVILSLRSSQRYEDQEPEVLELYGQKTRTVQIIPHGFGISRVGVINPSDTDYKEIKT